MMLAIIISGLLIGLAGSCHYSLLILCRSFCLKAKLSRFGRLFVTLYGAIVGHLIAAGLFAFGFGVGHLFGIGGFEGIDMMSSMDYYYFSLINMTTLGLGQIYPTDHLRLLAGIEAMTGFLLISISASFIFRATGHEEI